MNEETSMFAWGDRQHAVLAVAYSIRTAAAGYLNLEHQRQLFLSVMGDLDWDGDEHAELVADAVFFQELPQVKPITGLSRELEASIAENKEAARTWGQSSSHVKPAPETRPCRGAPLQRVRGRHL